MRKSIINKNGVEVSKYYCDKCGKFIKKSEASKKVSDIISSPYYEDEHIYLESGDMPTDEFMKENNIYLFCNDCILNKK